MKILAIRGENLASLPALELELEAGPLAETNIFAITGPTGSGKSTLLDALCLALFDRVPRLAEARGAPTADEGLPASDPRGIMRRGAAEASAEVDFIGVDGGRYRARWEVWRARKKPEGRLQDQRLRLFALEADGPRELSEGRKTDTLEAIRARVGLGFTEFRRAVLLAQGEFDAFLAARPDERAALLERMTGTERFAEISRLAHERSRAEAEGLHAARQRAEAIELLDPEARAGLEDRLASEKSALVAAREALERARQLEAWLRARAALEDDRKRAETERDAARARAEETKSLEARLARIHRVAALRPRHDALAAAARAEATERAEAEAAEALRLDLERSAERAKANEAEAEAKARGAAEALEAARPALARARALDEAIRRGAAEREASAARARDAAEAFAREEAKIREHAAKLRASRETSSEVRAWLEAHAFAEPLRGDAGQTALSELERSSEEADELERRRALAEGASEKRAGCEAALEAAARAREAAELEHAAARRARDAAAEAAEASSRPLDETALREARAIFGEAWEALRRLRRDAREAKRRRAEQRRHARQRSEAEAEAKRAEAEVEQASAREAEARGALLDVERAGGLASRRAELLVEGEPCPLCGSTAHPLAGIVAEPAPELERARAALGAATEARARAETKRQEARDEAARAEARLEALGAADRLAEGALSELARDLTEIWVRSPLLYRAGLARVGLLLPKRLPSDEADLAPAIRAIDAVEGELDAQAGAVEAARAALDAAETRLARAEAGRREAELRSDAEGRRLEDRAQAEAAAKRELEALRTTRAARLERLEASLASWPAKDRLHTDPGALASELRRVLEEAAAHREARARVSAELFSLEERGPELEERRAAAKATLEAAEAERAAAEKTEREHRAARAAELGGRPADEVEATLETEARRAREALEAARRTAAELGAQLGEARASAHLRKERAAARAAERAEAEAALEAALEGIESEAERTATRAALEAPPEDPAALEARRQRLLGDLTRAEATVSDRQDRLARHLETPPEGLAPDDTPASAAAKRETREAHTERLGQDLARLEAALEADDRARARKEAIAPELEAREARAATWAELSLLIGSADGKKLRTFAQSLTLDALLEQANLHLESLRPRYALRRAPRADMELEVVDHDMGDEIRPIGSLSGGETFLASLALALGLSDLSSRTVHVESLFVDEGFGALDPESLEIALGALDQLQASGRTVGVVSHVPEVAERLGFEVRVRPVSPGRSRVEVKGP